MAVTFESVSDCGLAATAGLLTRAFADYLVKIALTEEVLRAMQGTDHVDPAESWVIRRDGEPAGAILVARRGDTRRVAGMAFVPDARGQGLGRAAVEHVAARARVQGARRLVLEVIEQNAPAVRLYERTGFHRRRRLLSFAGPVADVAAEAGAVRPVTLAEAGAALTRLNDADWPWQISGATIAALTPPHVAYESGGAWVVLTDPAQATVTIRGLAAVPGAEPARLLHAVRQRHPGVTWRASALWPEEHAAWFTAAGFTPGPVTQWQMERAL